MVYTYIITDHYEESKQMFGKGGAWRFSSHDLSHEYPGAYIYDINRNRVSPEERLSNHPYRYDCDMHCITNEGTEEKAIYFCE